MEHRLIRLEATTQHIQEDLRDFKSDMRDLKNQARSDFRLLFGALISLGIGMAALMAKGFHWI
jgi:hypothetical protein